MSEVAQMTPEEALHAAHQLRTGLKAVASTSLLSFVTTSAMFLYVTILFFFVRPRLNRASPDIDENSTHVRAWKFLSTQSGRYFLSLLVSDLLVSIGVAMNWYWLSKPDPIPMKGGRCTFQAVMIQVGIVSDAIWNPIIASHIMLGLVFQKHFPDWSVWVVIASVWTLVGILTIIGPAALQNEKHGPFYAADGGWCWISRSYQNIQFWLHYLFVFAGAIIDIICYTMVFFHLRRHTKQFNEVIAQRNVQAFPLQQSNMPPGVLRSEEKGDSYAFNGAAESQGQSQWRTTFAPNPVQQQPTQVGAVEKTAQKMLLYPPAYMILTLPLATFRAGELLGRDWDPNILVAFGSIFACGGLVDTTLFWFTRNLGTGFSLTKLGFSRATGDSKGSKGRFPAYRWGTNSQNRENQMGQVTARIQVETRVETIEDEYNYGTKRYTGDKATMAGMTEADGDNVVYAPHLPSIKEGGHFAAY